MYVEFTPVLWQVMQRLPGLVPGLWCHGNRRRNEVIQGPILVVWSECAAAHSSKDTVKKWHPRRVPESRGFVNEAVRTFGGRRGCALVHPCKAFSSDHRRHEKWTIMQTFWKHGFFPFKRHLFSWGFQRPACVNGILFPFRTKRKPCLSRPCKTQRLALSGGFLRQ